jgi:hypothetical protein
MLTPGCSESKTRARHATATRVPAGTASGPRTSAGHRGREIDHFISIAHITQEPRKATRLGIGFIVPFQPPNPLGRELYASLGRRQYEEDWVTTDGRRVHWRKYATRAGRPVALRAAAAFKQDAVPGGTCDPLAALDIFYRRGRFRSTQVRYRRRQATRLTSRSPGLSEEWIVDRRRHIPLHFRLVEHGRAYGFAYTNTLEVSFLSFERLPLTARTEGLLELTPAERAVEVRD